MTGTGGRDGHVIDQLSAYLEGDVDEREAQRVRAHLDQCDACTRARDELRAIITSARGFDRPEPPPTLWPAIEGALARGESTLLSWRPFFLRGLAVGGLAGATLALVLVLGVGVVRRGSSSSPPAGAAIAMTGGRGSAPIGALDPLLEEAEAELQTAGAAYERSIEKLRALLAREEPRWNPDARARCAERLARLDEAIARSREAARRTPGDSAGNEILFAAYRSKIDFLAAAVQRGGPAVTGEGTP